MLGRDPELPLTRLALAEILEELPVLVADFEKVGHELRARVGKSHTLAVAVEYGKSDFLLERLKR